MERGSDGLLRGYLCEELAGSWVVLKVTYNFKDMIPAGDSTNGL